MHLKRLELFGFKTFSQKTEIDFTRGFLAVVGPNGSGKSNLTDAIRFCLGEHSVKAMRATRLEELVFAGSPVLKAAPHAEVTVIFDNEDGTLPLDTPEVAITRRLEKDGESKFYINRTSCRLRDIHEMLMGSGVGPGSFSVLGGKEVDQVLSTDPKERRSMLEETAGVNRYKFRKREAQRRLEKTAANLTRLHDILRELDLQLEESARQLERYKKYREAQVELKELELELAIQEWSRLEAGIASLKEQLQTANDELARCEAQAAVDRAELEAASLEKRQLDATREGYVAHCAELREAASVLRTRLEATRQRAQELAQTAASARLRLDSMAERTLECQKELEAAEAELPAARAAHEATTTALAAAKLDMEQLPLRGQGPHAQLRQRLDVAEKEHLKQVTRRETLRARQESDDTRILELIDAREGWRRELLQFGSQPEIDTELTEQLQEAGSLISAVEAEKKELEGKLQSVLQEKRQLESTRRPLVSRLAELEATLEDGAGLPPAVRAVMSWREPGVVGLLGQLVKVPSGLETAFEAALGGHVNDVVARDRRVASGLIERLKQERVGRATFWPLDLERQPPPPPQLPDRRGVVGLALELLGYGREIESVLGEILGRTVIMEDMPAALQLYDRCRGRRPHLVTRGGEYLNPSGALTGGSARRDNSGLLSRRRLLDEARVALKKQEGELQRCHDREEALLSQRSQTEAALSAARDEFRLLKGELADVESEGKRRQAERDRVQKGLTRADEELKALQKRWQDAEDELSLLAETLTQLQAEKDSLTEQLGSFQEEEARLGAQRDLLQAQLSQLQLEAERARQALAGWEAQAERARARRVELEVDHSQAQEEWTRCTGAEAGLEDEIRTLGAQLEQGEVALAERQAQLETLKRENAAKEAAWSELAIRVQKGDEALKTASAARTRLDIELAGQEARREEALARLGELPEGHEIKPAVPMTQEGLAKAKSRAGKLRHFLESFGSVNLGAQEDHERLEARRNELQEQVDDLEAGADSLRTIMGELDAVTVLQFQEAYARVNETFARIFTDLFQGGSARLELCNPDDPLESGVEIVACPPGKRLQNLALLSSGERALSAMAFLLSLLSCKPSPIVILDELDAPLDDSNVERVATRLLEFSSSSQFLVITHNRKTMEFADRLYGVTMEEAGVSRILSVKLNRDGAVTPEARQLMESAV